MDDVATATVTVGLDAIREAYRSQAWPLFTGLLLLGLGQWLRRAELVSLVSDAWRGWVVAGLAVAVAVGGVLVEGGDFLEVFIVALTVAAPALGLELRHRKNAAKHEATIS